MKTILSLRTKNRFCESVQRLIQPRLVLCSLTIETPNSEGFVAFDDWDKKDRDQEIGKIWSALEESAARQGEALGVAIKAESWLVYPTLNKDRHYLYYATNLVWDGHPQTNIKASIFDRRGYVTFVMTPPVDSTLPADQVEAVIEEVLDAYSPGHAEGYADFTEGDKIAAAGVLGVLAGLVGVKFGKAAALGLGALLIAFAKKLWLLLIIPLIALKNFIFKRKK